MNNINNLEVIRKTGDTKKLESMLKQEISKTNLLHPIEHLNDMERCYLVRDLNNLSIYNIDSYKFIIRNYNIDRFKVGEILYLLPMLNLIYKIK